MTHATRRIGLGFVLALLSGCGSQGDTSSDSQAAEAAARAAIAEARQAYTEAALNGDVDALMALYTEDPVFMPPNSDPLQGRDALEEFVSGMFANGGFSQFQYDMLELYVLGDDAAEVISYSFTLPGDEGVSDGGSDIHIWQRQEDGSWKIHRDLFNSHSPL